jgi:hypothetical protein
VATVDLTTSLQQSVEVERLHRDVEALSRIRRDTGGPGEDAAAEYLADQLRKSGVPVEIQRLPAFLSYPRAAALHVGGPNGPAIPCLTHSFSRSTAAGGVVLELLAGPADAVEQARGQAVLVNGLCTPATVLRASRAGCGALVFANEDHVIHHMIATTIWGTPGFDQKELLPTIPVVSVNRDGGAQLQALAAGGATARVWLRTEVDTGWLTSKLPEVRIRGSQDPDRFVLVGGHYCAWDVGVTDNATGNACLVELARLLWSARAKLARGVRLCWWPGHSQGRYSGSTWYADTFFRDLDAGGLAYHNIDSPGVRGATRYVARHTTAEVEGFCRRIIADVTGQGEAPVHRPARAADQSFLANGLPSFSTCPVLPDDHPDRCPWTGSAGAWWWHSEHDTLDKADPVQLAQDARVSLHGIVTLANAPVLPFDYGRVGEELHQLLQATERHAQGHLDLGALVAAAGELAGRARQFGAWSRGVSDAQGQARANDTLIRLGRVLNPVLYSRAGRFQHDPAEWSPIMRARGSALLPGLARAVALPDLVGRDEHGFLAAQLTREGNRVRAAIDEARALIEAALNKGQ